MAKFKLKFKHFRSESTLEPDTGPDKLLPADSFTSSSPSVPVKLWMPGEDEECDDEDLRCDMILL